MAQLSSLKDLFAEEIQDIYDAEQQILQALPKMQQAAHSPKLKQAFETHLQQTQGHVQRLEQVFQLLGTPAKGKTCVAMQGIIKEGQKLMQEQGDAAVKDAGMIAAAQKVEHYEIASYGSVRTWANELGLTQAQSLLQQTLNEEEQTDKLLTQIAESSVNIKAENR